MTKDIKHKRNGNLFDTWSIVHLCTGVLFGWLLNPLTALVIMTLWEPFEIFVLSPLLARRGIIFGYESLRNSLSDIVFNTIGILLGAYVLSELLDPPFQLF
jgi:hypothetical protein